VAELVYATDLKSVGRKAVWVRIPSSRLMQYDIYYCDEEGDYLGGTILLTNLIDEDPDMWIRNHWEKWKNSSEDIDWTNIHMFVEYLCYKGAISVPSNIPIRLGA